MLKQDDEPPLICAMYVVQCVIVVLVGMMPMREVPEVAKAQVIVQEVSAPIYPLYVGTTPVPTCMPTSTPTPTPTNTPTPTSMPAPTLTIGPLGDVNGNPAPAPDLYPWADWAWRDFAAHIVKGECVDCPEACRVVACTLIRDVLQGWQPYDLRKRWYGWMEPEWKHRMAVWDALQPGGCAGLPWYRYVGNESDYGIWLRKGIVTGNEEVDWYGNTVAVR